MNRHACCFLLIVVIAAISFFTSNARGAALVGFWAFDEGEGTVAGDSVFGNDGTIHQGTWVEGICGYALSFDGESSYVQVPNAPYYNMGEAVSVEAWVLMTPWQSCSQPDVFDKSHRGLDQPPYYSGYVIQGALAQPSALGFAACNGNSCPEVHSGIPLNDSVWHFVVGTASTQDSVIRFYLDGEMTMELPFRGPINANMGDIFIGKHYLLGRYFSGLIDEVKVYDGALTPEEVSLHYDFPCYGCGDVNGDNIVDVGDVVCLISYLYLGASGPDPICTADVDCNSEIDNGDLIYLINYLFLGTSAPCPECCSQ